MISNKLLKDKILQKFLIDNFQEKEAVLLSSVCSLDNPKKTSGKELLYLDVKYLRGQSDGDYKKYGFEVNTGDYVILVDGENSGEVFEIPCQGYMGSTFKKLKFSDKIIKKYIMYFITLKKELLKGNKTGSAIPHLNKKLFASLELYIPSIEEQNIIVNKIDELFSLLDKKEKNDQEKEKLKQVLKEKILNNAIHGFLVENNNSLKPVTTDEITDDVPYQIPSNWKWTKISSIGDVIGGGTPKTDEQSYWNGSVNWITPADMKSDSKYITSGKSSITEKGLNESSARLMPKGTIVISSRAPIGYVKISTEDVSTSQGCKSIVVNNEDVYNEYVFYYIKAIPKYLNSIGTGTTFREISGKTLGNVLIPTPPLEEQKKIVEKIESLFELIEQL